LLRNLIVNRSRTFIFDTALAPPCAAAALAALEVIRKEPGRLAALAENTLLLRSELRRLGLTVPHSPSAIVPLMVGTAERALRLAAALEDRGFLCVAIRPPTVPPGTSRLRMTVMATHPQESIRELACAVGEIAAG
ncbi:MAG: aminotransferase class I/II-fold pyridoxal phosphate-dependent enzyme, partial [Candidatus Sumerlaeaceae bacterium]|nr:aminotransferase class I/II-fold pyridoxal phosphate-dependent enzyme [Candidatus Sumerlaeaceae bacterium]